MGVGEGYFLLVFGLADRRTGVAGKGLIGRKRRVNGNQVNALIVQRPQERVIVHDSQRPVGNVQHSHFPLLDGPQTAL